MAGQLELGIDIGGTFTDFIVTDNERDAVFVWKTLTTPDDPSLAVISGIDALCDAHGLDPADVERVVHATTLITNALIERKGASTALLTTKGFADLIEIGREVRYDLYDIFLKMPEPLVSAERRFEIAERIDHTGAVVEPLDESHLESLAEALTACRAESLAICLLHSYANPDHEQRIASVLSELLPELPVSTSADVAGEIREYERFSTTAANAYVQPLAARYLNVMAEHLRDAGITAPLQIMLSNGGTTTAGEAARLPVRLVESGPAAGALIAAHYARLLGENHVLAFDMGGTTAKLCAVDAGQPAIGSALEVARVHRFKRGSGLPIRAPSVELIEIGAGGGSIARIDELGLLTVGPDSAGADPGPACYGLGGALPTVTDADLALGYLNPDYFLGGRMSLNAHLATNALDTSLGEALKLPTVEIAAGIHDVVNEMMATAAGVYIAERGQDPRRYALVATGGAAPAHAVEVARKLGVGRVIVPPAAGVASAGGLLVAPPRLDYARSALTPLSEISWESISELFEAMEYDARTTLTAMGVANSAVTINRSVDARYVNQGHEISVPLNDAITDDASASSCIQRAFDETYRQLFGRTVDGVPVECVTWRTTVRGVDGTLPRAVTTDADAAPPTTRSAYFRGHGALKTPVFQRSALLPGEQHSGPAIIEEAQSTTVIGPGDVFAADQHGNIIVQLAVSGAAS